MLESVKTFVYKVSYLQHYSTYHLMCQMTQGVGDGHDADGEYSVVFIMLTSIVQWKFSVITRGTTSI